MKFGSQSVSRNPALDPQPGDPATILAWTDRYAGTVLYVDGDRIGIQRDRAVLVSGPEHDGSAQYDFRRDYNGRVFHFEMTRDGFRETLRTGPHGLCREQDGQGYGLVIGEKEEWHDPRL
jgi:hypothetical protein